MITTRCGNCGMEVPVTASYCVSCGLPLISSIEAWSLRCYVHPERFPLARCTLCGRPICASCRLIYSGRVVCKVCYMKDVLSSNAINNLRLHLLVRRAFSR